MKWNSTLYNTDHSFVFEYGKDVVSLLNPTANERILDVGCGSGQLTSEISKIANEVISIDNSPEMIADATSKFSNVTFELADATTFSFNEPFMLFFQMQPYIGF